MLSHALTHSLPSSTHFAYSATVCISLPSPPSSTTLMLPTTLRQLLSLPIHVRLTFHTPQRTPTPLHLVDQLVLKCSRLPTLSRPPLRCLSKPVPSQTTKRSPIRPVPFPSADNEHLARLTSPNRTSCQTTRRASKRVAARLFLSHARVDSHTTARRASVGTTHTRVYTVSHASFLRRLRSSQHQ